MIDFFIYDKDNDVINIYKKVLLKLKERISMDYYVNNIENLDNFSFDNTSLYNKKIFLIDIDSKDNSGIEFIRRIREDGDWTSQIIVTTHNNVNISLYRLLVLDYISKTNDFINRVYDAIISAINILFSEATLNFKTNNEIFQVSYNDICYIEKNLNDNDSTIFTKNNSYTIKCSINQLLRDFKGDSRFFKTHRSCIVNINNITCFDMKNNTIKFDILETNLISRNNKKILKDKILERNGVL